MVGVQALHRSRGALQSRARLLTTLRPRTDGNPPQRGEYKQPALKTLRGMAPIQQTAARSLGGARGFLGLPPSRIKHAIRKTGWCIRCARRAH